MTQRTEDKALVVFQSIKVPKKIDQKAVEKFREKARHAYEVAKAMQIVDLETKTTAEAFTKACSDLEKSVRTQFKPELDRRDAEKKRATAEKKELVDFIESVIELIKSGKDDVDFKVREWIAKENKRIDEENRKKTIEAQKQAESDKKADAKSLREIGTPEARQAAREITSAPAIAAPVHLEERVTASHGSIHRSAWTTVCAYADPMKSLKALVAAAAKDFEKYGKYLKEDWPAMNSDARSEGPKGRFDVPGYKAFDKGATAHK